MPTLNFVADRLTAFTARRQLRDYLLLNRDPVDHRDFLVPANLPLKLLVAATLAALDQDVAVCALLPEVERAIAPYRDQLNRGRLARLRQLSEVLCGPGVE